MKDYIEELIQKWKLKQYVKKDGECQHSSSPRKGKVVVCEVEKSSMRDSNDSESEEDNRESIDRLVAMVIFGGYPVEGGETRKIVKRKWKEILSVASTSTAEVGSS